MSSNPFTRSSGNGWRSSHARSSGFPQLSSPMSLCSSARSRSTRSSDSISRTPTSSRARKRAAWERLHRPIERSTASRPSEGSSLPDPPSADAQRIGPKQHLGLRTAQFRPLFGHRASRGCHESVGWHDLGPAVDAQLFDEKSQERFRLLRFAFVVPKSQESASGNPATRSSRFAQYSLRSH